MRLSLRTQQVIADETNITSVVDPLGGSYMVETLTTQMERDIFTILDTVDSMGGTIKAIEDGWFQRKIAESSYDFAIRKASGENPVIGVNKYIEANESEPQIGLHPYDLETEARQVANLTHTRTNRDEGKVQALLKELIIHAREESKNLMPITIELVKARASMGEIVETLKSLWGTYRENPVI